MVSPSNNCSSCQAQWPPERQLLRLKVVYLHLQVVGFPNPLIALEPWMVDGEPDYFAAGAAKPSQVLQPAYFSSNAEKPVYSNLNLSQFLHSPGMPELWRARLLIPFIPVKQKRHLSLEVRSGSGDVRPKLVTAKQWHHRSRWWKKLTDHAGEKEKNHRLRWWKKAHKSPWL